MRKNNWLRLGAIVGLMAFLGSVATYQNKARAEFLDGARLLQLLTQQRGPLDRATGVGYVMGVADSIMGVESCPPPDLKAGQIADVVAAFIQSRPDLQHVSADGFVSNLLRRVYPCIGGEKGVVQK